MAAALPTLLLGALGVGGGILASKMMTPKQPSQSPIALPTPPKPEDSAAKAEDMMRKKRASMSQTVYTSPLGVSGQADIAKKTLLGQ